MPVEQLNGFYVGYFAAAGGEGIALFCIRNATIAGADAGGFGYDGTITQQKNGDDYDVAASVKIPPNSASIVGVSSGQHGLAYNVNFKLPQDLAATPFVRIDTPYGPVNMRLVKLRDLPSEVAAAGGRNRS